jgi:tetratricopeptide (TPR) repeat protein
MRKIKLFQVIVFVIIPMIFVGCEKKAINIEKPEKIVSKRHVVYDKQTYLELAELWKAYYNEFPSEDAYANWMYAARYAEWPNYESLLEDGIDKYYAQPTLLYLKALLRHGKENDLESINLLERAVKLDPTFVDPWFGLVIDYMGNGELEKSDSALRKLLSADAISDQVMDYNYNVISLLEENAILITNGDNDTYPGWILTKILNYRPDVKIVNRSLLNTEWYPRHLINNEGIPSFITSNGLTKLREDIVSKIKSGEMKSTPIGPFSDVLISKLIGTTQKNNRPIYLASTLYQSEIIKNFKEEGINLGLVTKIKSGKESYPEQIKKIVGIWLDEFRTGGLTSWNLRYGKKTASGKWLAINYGMSIKLLMGPIKKYVPEKRLELFNWYIHNILDLLTSEKSDAINSAWCTSADIKEIKEWCKTKNYL